MKICPACAYENDERFPTCLMCNRSIVDVTSVATELEGTPQFERRIHFNERQRIRRRQLFFAMLFHGGVVTLSAMIPGGVFVPVVLFLYFIAAIFVVVAIIRDWVGQQSASFLQAGLSVVLMIQFGPMQPFIFLMLVAHASFAAVVWHWVSLIYDANR